MVTNWSDVSKVDVAPLRMKARGLSIAFGGHQVLIDVDIDLAEGQIALLRGINGCGKTTLLNILSGFINPDTGSVLLESNGNQIDILHRSPDRVARLGIARLWQDIRLFPSMTVMENVLVASPHTIGLNPLMVLVAAGKMRRQELEFREKAFAWLDLLGMAERADSSGDKLSVGQSKRVAIARMLQTGAQILLLDEPLAGLDFESAEKLVYDLNRLANITRKAMLIVEHNHETIAPACNICFTLEGGHMRREELKSR